MNEYVIFDLDGTLLDSMGFWDGVGREYLNRFGITTFPSDFNKKVLSMSITQSSEYFRECFGIDVPIEDITEGMRKIVASKYHDMPSFKENVRATLDELAGRKVKMCIATATYGSVVQDALQVLDATSYFDFVLTCNDVGFGKDNPKIFYDALKRLGGDKSNTVIVEDSLHAISTAKAEGFKVIAVKDRYQFDTVDDIKKLADIYLDTIDAKTILEI